MKKVDTTCPMCGKDTDLKYEDLMLAGCYNCNFPSEWPKEYGECLPNAIKEEILKCKNNPYYFATKYLNVKSPLGVTQPFKTPLNEENFNSIFKD
jgi:hypothetical protein